LTTSALARAWQIQRRVIGALLMREVLTRYGRHNVGFLWLFLEPMMFTLGVAALWTFSGMHQRSSIPIVAFAITGYSAVLLWRNMPNRCVKAIEPNLALMYHQNVKVIDIYLSRVILEAAGSTLSFLILIFCFTFAGLMQPPEDVFKVIGGWLLLAWFGLALAILVGTASELSELVEKLWHPTTYLLFPLSGSAFLTDALPQRMQDVVLALPMVHGVELLREGYFGSSFRAHYDLQYMVIVCSLMTIFGLSNVRRIGKEVSPG
jgi:ABC-type polysaccharide/polyol phosphate export permease